MECAKRGAKVILACRDAAKAEATVASIRRKTNNDDVHFLQMDLASLNSIREFVVRFIKMFGRANIIVNNAGEVLLKVRHVSEVIIFCLHNTFLRNLGGCDC